MIPQVDKYLGHVAAPHEWAQMGVQLMELMI